MRAPEEVPLGCIPALRGLTQSTSIICGGRSYAGFIAALDDDADVNGATHGAFFVDGHAQPGNVEFAAYRLRPLFGQGFD